MKFGQVTKNKLSGVQIVCKFWHDRRTGVRDLEKGFKIVFKVLCVRAESIKKTLPPCWNGDWFSLRKLAREVSNICCWHEHWHPYKNCVKK